MARDEATLLDIARLEEGTLELHLQSLDLGSLIEEAIVEERHLAGAKRVALEANLPSELPNVSADRDVLLRVLINLVDNGLKFTHAGGHVWVEVRLEAEAVRVDVVDTGLGIPEGQKERVFEKFTQVRRHIQARRGSGLGLAFCRMAVEAHGGHIWVEDGPEGKGSRFAFTIPRVTNE